MMGIIQSLYRETQEKETDAQWIESTLRSRRLSIKVFKEEGEVTPK
jgi:hypothetical protein